MDLWYCHLMISPAYNIRARHAKKQDNYYHAFSIITLSGNYFPALGQTVTTAHRADVNFSGTAVRVLWPIRSETSSRAAMDTTAEGVLIEPRGVEAPGSTFSCWKLKMGWTRRAA